MKLEILKADVATVTQALFDRKTELVIILETANDKKFVTELVNDIQSIARVEKALDTLQ